jgi:hypothetical protein
MNTVIVGLLTLIIGIIIGYVIHGLYPHLWMRRLKIGYNEELLERMRLMEEKLDVLMDQSKEGETNK